MRMIEMSSYINGKRAEIIVFGCLSLHEFLCIFWVLCFLKIPDCLFYIDLYYGFHRICWGIFFIYSQLFYHFTTAHFLLTHQGRLSDHSHAFFLQTNNLASSDLTGADVGDAFVNAVPEPASLAVLGLGGLLAMRRIRFDNPGS